MLDYREHLQILIVIIERKKITTQKHPTALVSVEQKLIVSECSATA